jgi:DNA (cytosine-5)-methyltransferase 1
MLSQGGKYMDLPELLRRYRDDIFEDKYKRFKWMNPSWT